MPRNLFNVQNFSNDIIKYCDRAQVKTFEKNEIVTTYIVNRNMILIILDGSADLIRYDFNGNQTIVEKFNKYDVLRRNIL